MTKLHFRHLGLALLLTTGCGAFTPPPPSSGQCRGTLAGAAFDEPLYPEESYFYRDDQHGGIEHAFLDLTAGAEASRGRRALQVRAHLADMPEAKYVGDHPLPAEGERGAGYVDAWAVTIPSKPALSGGVLSLRSASRTRLEGSATLRFADGSELGCELGLSRNYRRDTDD